MSALASASGRVSAGQSLKDFLGEGGDLSLCRGHNGQLAPWSLGQQRCQYCVRTDRQPSRSSDSLSSCSVGLKTVSLPLQLAGWCLRVPEVVLRVQVGPWKRRACLAPQTAVPLLHRSWANAARIPIFSVSQERGHPRAVTGISSTVKHLSMKAGPRASGIAVKSDLTRKSCCWDNLFSRTGSNGYRQARLIALRKRKKTLESTEDKTCHTTASRKMSFLSAMGAEEPQACRNVLPPQEENTAPKPGLLGRPHLVRSSSLPEVETGGVRLE